MLAWGGSALDVALARVLDLTPSAAEPIKHELSLGEEGEAAGLDARRGRRGAPGDGWPSCRSFARELVASLRFYQEQPNSLGIAEILITGGGGRLRRARGRARAADRRPRSRCRPARARQGAAQAPKSQNGSDRLAGRRRRPGDRGLDARRQPPPPRAEARPQAAERRRAARRRVAVRRRRRCSSAGYLLASSKVNDSKATLQALQDELASLPAPAQQPQVSPELVAPARPADRRAQLGPPGPPRLGSDPAPDLRRAARATSG